jgi:hypothetical protein
MNKLTKVGCSALCGSLAAISAASAGDITVTGGVDMSWMGKEKDTVGNPIGIGSNLTFKGSGELDNGWAVDLTIANLNGNAYSSTAVALDMGALGKLNFNSGDSGNGIDAFDDKMPTAWEEPWGAGLGTNVKLVSGVGPYHNVQYTTPTVIGTTLTFAVAEMGQSDTADKTTGGIKASALGKGYDMTVNINPSFGTEILSGLNIFVGGHYADNYDRGGKQPKNEQYEGVAGITFDIGPVSIGYGKQGHVTGETLTATAVDFYRNEQYGVAFNINDDLSISYGYHQSYKTFVNPSRAPDSPILAVESFQLAYTMGGASIRLAEIQGENLSYSNAETNDKDATILSVALAF